MITLFIDSSKKDLSVVLNKCNKIIYSSNIVSYANHSNYLMNEIINGLDSNNITINDIDNIVVLNGPGSFTGVRIGVTVAKTLSWVLNKRIYTLTTLKALSLHEKDISNIISIIPDKNNYGYFGVYTDKVSDEKYLNITDLKDMFKNKEISIVYFDDCEFIQLVYDLLSSDNKVFLNKVSNYDYLNIISYALNTKALNPHIVKPIYLKKIDAEKNYD